MTTKGVKHTFISESGKDSREEAEEVLRNICRIYPSSSWKQLDAHVEQHTDKKWYAVCVHKEKVDS